MVKKTVKKTVKKDGKDVFQFNKPQDPATLAEFQKCVQEGLNLANRAEKLDTNSDAVWSYKANMMIQQSRLAEMNGDKAQVESLKADSDKAKARFKELADARKAKEDAEKAAKEAEQNASNANKK